MQRFWRPLCQGVRRAASFSWKKHQKNRSLPTKRNSILLYAATSTAVGGIAGALLLSRGFESYLKPTASGHKVLGSQKRQYASREITLEALEEIRDQLGKESVSIDEDDIEDHGDSEWSTSHTTSRPVAVIRPNTTEEVSFVVKVCSRHNIPMVPFGAGSSVEGNSTSPHCGVCIDLSLMDKIVEFHPDDLDVVVQAGVNWMNLNDAIKDSGLFLPLDPSPTALVGGMIATNCSGTNAMRYGTMKDYVINLTVVLANGSVIKTRHRPRKTSAGYNLNALLTGSEGTLGIITEATLKLAILPEKYSVAIATFPSVKTAAGAASAMIRKGVNLVALELMDEVQMKIINQSGGVGGRHWEEAATLFLKFSGSNQVIADSATAVENIAKRFDCQSFIPASDQASMDSLWSARKQALWASLAVRPEGTEIWSTDVAVPISRMAELIDECKTDASRLGLFSSVLGHVGDGNFHQMIMYNPNKPSEKQMVKDFIDEMMRKAIALEGTVSGEHGIGLGKKQCLREEVGDDTLNVMRSLKESLDPRWLMNPGKVFDE